MKKNLYLSAVGIVLQTIGGICLMAAVAGIAKDVKHQVKVAIVKELSKQIQE